jgi:hypothetical protein
MQQPAPAPEPEYRPSSRPVIRPGSQGPGDGGGFIGFLGLLLLAAILVGIGFLFGLAGSTILDSLGEVLSIVLWPLRYYLQTLAAAMIKQDVYLPLRFLFAFIPIEIALLILFRKRLMDGLWRYTVEACLARCFLGDCLLTICFILASVYVAIIAQLYNQYTYLIGGMSLLCMVTLIVRLVRLAYFFPDSVTDIADTMRYQRYL